MRRLRAKRPIPAQRGIGAFELVESPQDPSPVLAAGLKDSLGGQPGLRLQGGGGRRVFFGGQLTLQHFTRPPAASNDADSVRAAVLHVNAPRLVAKTRGVFTPVLPTGVGD
ncbi:MAG: hypothetical protein ACJ75S_08620 [Solirubrobacterales bacterium]